MGNQPSGPGGDHPQGAASSQQQGRPREAIRNLLRNNGALGLSKAELDARCQPSGLYSSTAWEYKQIRRLIGDGKLAARVKGTEDRIKEGDMECPICFFYYSAVNQTKCCQACICTECYLQVRNPKDPATDCPFCNQKLTVTMMAPLTKDDIQAREAEEQRTIEAKIRANSVDTELTANSDATTKSPPPTLNPLSQPPNNPGFGASLEQNDRVALMRKRSTSGSSADPGDSAFSASSPALGMTPQERQALEAEMKAQHQHPLARRMEQEEEERRFRNQQEYMSSPQYQERVREQERMRHMQARRLLLHATGGSRSGRRGGSSRDWNRIVEAFESGSAGNSVQSLDDLVVLEAAIMLSSMEQQRQQQQQQGDGEGNNNNADGTASSAAPEESSDDFAARHARAGFPLARARVGGGDALLTNASRVVPQPWMMQALMSEEEQIAMAIAASLRDAPANNDNNNDDDDNNNNDEQGENENNENDNNDASGEDAVAVGEGVSEEPADASPPETLLESATGADEETTAESSPAVAASAEESTESASAEEATEPVAEPAATIPTTSEDTNEAPAAADETPEAESGTQSIESNNPNATVEIENEASPADNGESTPPPADLSSTETPLAESPAPANEE